MRTTYYCLGAIVAISVVLHVAFIDQPEKPVFDEVYFATAASGYATRTPHYDIHPPLGKVIYSLFLAADGKDYSGQKYTFVTVGYDKEKNEIILSAPSTTFGDFPFVRLRLVSAFFGVALVLATYLFLSSLTENRIAPLLGALFVAFDAALLTETRLILLNGMYLAFGVLSLWAIFKTRPQPILSGILLGCALSTKLVAIAFIAPLLLGTLLKKGDKTFLKLRHVVLSVFIGGVVLLVSVFIVSNALIPAEARIAYYHPFVPLLTVQTSTEPTGFLRVFAPVSSEIVASWLESIVTISGYTTGVSVHPAASNWYEWILMKKQLWLANNVPEKTGVFFYMGNFAVWLGALLAIACSFMLIVRAAIKSAPHDGRVNALLLLVGSYMLSLLPFSLIERPAFLYHYLPALLFGICALSLLLGWYLEKKSPRERKMLVGAIVSLVVLGFLVAVPSVYGIQYLVFQ